MVCRQKRKIQRQFPLSLIDNILPFLPPHDFFIFITTINICQKEVTHELMVKLLSITSDKSKQSMQIMSQQSIYLIQYLIYVL